MNYEPPPVPMIRLSPDEPPLTRDEIRLYMPMLMWLATSPRASAEARRLIATARGVI